jgi:hypothetical protein
MFGTGGVGSYLRNLSRSPGYGLRKHRRQHGSGGPADPVGPSLVRGRGLARRRPGSALLAVARLAALLLLAAALAAGIWTLIGLS